MKYILYAGAKILIIARLSVNMKSYKYILPSREAVTGEKSDTAENTWTSTHSPDTCHLPDKKDELPIVLQAVGTHSKSHSAENIAEVSLSAGVRRAHSSVMP